MRAWTAPPALGAAPSSPEVRRSVPFSSRRLPRRRATGRQLLRDPPEVVARLEAEYEAILAAQAQQ